MRMSDWSSDVCSSDLARWLERAHHTSLAQYQAYLDYRPVAAADPALVLALIRASAPRSSDLGDHENRLLTLPDMGWQRSEERRVGKECVSTFRSRWVPSH